MILDSKLIKKRSSNRKKFLKFEQPLAVAYAVGIGISVELKNIFSWL